MMPCAAKVRSNLHVKLTAEQRGRCSVPVALRAPAAAQLFRWASGDAAA